MISEQEGIMKNIWYFKFDYPPDLAALQAANFARPCYPPGWPCSCGKGIIDLMNDALGWCLIRFENDVPSSPEDGATFILLSEADYNALVARYRAKVRDGSNGIWAGSILAHRWDCKPTAFCKDLIIDFNGKTWGNTLEYSDDLQIRHYETEGLPKYLVKNPKKEYLDKFRETGEVILSSITRFRTMGGHGQDEKEGVKKTDICIDVGGTEEIKANELGRFISYFKMEGTGSIDISGKLVIKDNAFLPDSYIFCASYKALDAFGGSSYEIVDIPRFGQTLFESIRKADKEVYSWMMAPVTYGGAKDPIKTLEELKKLGNYNINVATMLDCFFKSSSFKDEEEFRFAFFTKKKPIDMITIIHDTNLVKCCEFPD